MPQTPVLSTRYEIVEAGGTSTPVEITIQKGTTQILFGTAGNTGTCFVVASETSPGPQTNFTNPDAFPVVPGILVDFDYRPQSQRPGTNKMWVFGSDGGDYIHVSEVVRNQE